VTVGVFCTGRQLSGSGEEFPAAPWVGLEHGAHDQSSCQGTGVTEIPSQLPVLVSGGTVGVTPKQGTNTSVPEDFGQIVVIGRAAMAGRVLGLLPKWLGLLQAAGLLRHGGGEHQEGQWFERIRAVFALRKNRTDLGFGGSELVVHVDAVGPVQPEMAAHTVPGAVGQRQRLFDPTVDLGQAAGVVVHEQRSGGVCSAEVGSWTAYASFPVALADVLADHVAARGLTGAEPDQVLLEAPDGGVLRYDSGGAASGSERGTREEAFLKDGRTGPRDVRAKEGRSVRPDPGGCRWR
jgi:hypothetical protein